MCNRAAAAAYAHQQRTPGGNAFQGIPKRHCAGRFRRRIPPLPQAPVCYRFNTASPGRPRFSGLWPHPFEVCLTAGAAGVQTRMPQQPESTSSTLALSPATLPDPDGNPETGQTPIEHVPQRIPKWLERIELLLRVMLRMYIGLAVCYAPWSPMFWDQNPLFLQFPMLAHFAAHGAVRGIVSGLGLLNLWYALQDVLRHREG